MQYILVDGDVVKYRCGFAAEKTRYLVQIGYDKEGLRTGVPPLAFDNAKEANAYMKEYGIPKDRRQSYQEVEPVENALHSVKLMMQNIQSAFPKGEIVVYFSCATKDNWRTKLYPQYKANRKPRRPEHETAIREYMEKKYSCLEEPHMEADDSIAMDAYAYRKKDHHCVIATIDKDMDQIPGMHYNFVTHEAYEVSRQDAMYLLDLQIIAGDSTDNIPGIKDVGMKTAARLLDEHGDPAIVYDHAYDNLVAGEYWFYLNKALVQLPWTIQERDRVVAEFTQAKANFEVNSE